MANVNLTTVVTERTSDIINWAAKQCGTNKSEFLKAWILHMIDTMCLESKYDAYKQTHESEN